MICSKCGKECYAKAETKSGNLITSDCKAVSMCCGADIGYEVEIFKGDKQVCPEEIHQGHNHYGIETSSSLGELQDSKFREPHQYPRTGNIVKENKC